MFSKTLSNRNLFAEIKRPLAVALALLMLTACAPYQARKKAYTPFATGEASWYGPGFQGRRTASGEKYNQKALTAAHKTLPLGSSVRVTNVENGKSVIVRINDRGPFVRGRIIDLSKAAADRIGVRLPGTGQVELATLSKPQDDTQPQENTAVQEEEDRF